MVKRNLGIITLSNNSGLGNQTRRLTYMLRPERILAIDSSSFSKNRTQHWDWYDNFVGYKIHGFPSDREIRIFMKDLTHILVCENPFNFHMLSYARQLGIKTYIQSNYEFCDHLDKRIELPTKFLMPSHWKIEEMCQRFGAERVQYLPPPVDPQEFKDARDINFVRGTGGNLLHIIGTLAAHDRNGTLDLFKALKYAKENFILTIKSQHPLPNEYMTSDRRVRYEISDTADPVNLYKDYDALILPRRYGGLSLTTQEALMSGLPVIMTDISPNNKILPADWLVPAKLVDSFHTRTEISVYSAVAKALARKIDEVAKWDCEKPKVKAFEIGYDNYSPTVLKPKYEELFTFS